MASKKHETEETNFLNEETYEFSDSEDSLITDESETYTGYGNEPEYSAYELSKMETVNIDAQINLSYSSSSEDETPLNRLVSLDWCSCKHCSLMPSYIECKCCIEIKTLLGAKLDKVSCICENEDFKVLCLNRAVLETALILHRRSKDKFKLLKKVANRQYRFAAYYQFSAWSNHYEFLGKGVRVVIPSCVINTIREAYPSQGEDYTGFKDFQKQQIR